MTDEERAAKIIYWFALCEQGHSVEEAVRRVKTPPGRFEPNPVLVEAVVAELQDAVRTTYREAIEEAARALESYASVHSNPVLIALDFQRAAPVIVRRLIEGEEA